MKNTTLFISVFLLSSCATVDKAMKPVDEVMHGTESTYQSASHSVSETMNSIGEGASKIRSGIYETALAKMFLSDETVAKNREENYVIWNSTSKYDVNKILSESVKESGIDDASALKTSDKMKILKDYFFQVLKEEHARDFSTKHKKPEFNEFLTDRENIKTIHAYKIALAESEHQWRINIGETQKKVAQLMLSTLYSSPVLKYASYNPYDEEIFFTIESKIPGFKQKLKVDAKKDTAKNMKQQVKLIQPYVFFDLKDNVLEFVGITLKYQGSPLVGEVVESTYARQSDVVFTSDDISLESLDVQYYNVIKNVKPPVWFNNLPANQDQVIGYGEGINKEDAKKEAFRDIAMSIKTTVSAEFKSEKSVAGSLSANKYKSTSKQTVDEVAIKGSKVLKIEKKDGLWFVAILHERKGLQ